MLRQGNGYNGYSMSNNAVAAYESGEMPISKWTKNAILETLEDNEDLYNKANNLPAWILKDMLKYSSWHHTSKHYNRTDFYIFDIEQLINLTDEDVKRMKINRKNKLAQTKEKRAQEKKEREARKKAKQAEAELKERCENVLKYTKYKRLSTLVNKVKNNEFDLEALEVKLLNEKINTYENQIKGLKKALDKAEQKNDIKKIERLKEHIKNNIEYLNDLKRAV